MTIGALIGLIFVTPLGALADITHNKRLLVTASITAIILSSGIVFIWQNSLIVTSSKLIQAIAAAAIMPAVTSITLGLVGQKGLTARLGINEAWSHAGNAVTAILGGIIGFYFGISGVFYVLTTMGILATLSLIFIRPKDIDIMQQEVQLLLMIIVLLNPVIVYGLY